MMLASPPTPYSSLPNAPHANALPGGVPYGPWGNLYRSAPGAQIPAVSYPGMTRYRGGMHGAGVTIQGSPVTIQGGLGAVLEGNGMMGLLFAGLLSAGVAAAFAMARDSGNPVRNPALLMGGLTIGSGLLAAAIKKNKEAPPADATA